MNKILVEEDIDIDYIKRNLSKDQLKEFFDIASIAGAYETITRGIPGVFEGTHQFIKDIEIAQLLKSKFPNMNYDSAEGFKNWLEDRISVSDQSKVNAVNRLQGDGAGEVDFIRKMRGNLRSIFTKVDYAKDVNGNISNNVPGIDAVEVNRFTGKVINEFQIKTLRSGDNVKKVLKDFVNNNNYNKKVTLVGPKELIEEAKKQGLQNPMKVRGSIEENAKSAEALKNKVQNGDMITELTHKAVVKKMASGALVGAAISIGISSLFNYIAYKKGKITLKEMLTSIGKDGAKGSITGGALAGMSLFIPGGVVGFGVGFVVGSLLRKSLDDAFGDGVFAEILDVTKSVQVNVGLLHNGSIYIAELVEVNNQQIDRAMNIVEELSAERVYTISRLQKIESYYQNRSVIAEENNSVFSSIDKLDKLRERVECNIWEI